MGTNQFMEGFAKLKITNLRTSIFLANQLSSENVTHLDHPICSSATSGEQAMLMRRPCYSFDSCLVVIEFINSLASLIPNNYFVIISSWSQILLISWPFQSANLLGMVEELHDIIFRGENVPLQNSFISGPGGQKLTTPRHWAHSHFMACKFTSFPLFVHIPDQDLTFVTRYSQIVAIVGPTNRRYQIIAKFTEPRHFRCISIPKVDTIS